MSIEAFAAIGGFEIEKYKMHDDCKYINVAVYENEIVVLVNGGNFI